MSRIPAPFSVLFFFFNDTATTEIYTLSLHDALPIYRRGCPGSRRPGRAARTGRGPSSRDRKSTRLNSSHGYISYAVFCLKKKKKHTSSSKLATISHMRTLKEAREL